MQNRAWKDILNYSIYTLRNVIIRTQLCTQHCWCFPSFHFPLVTTLISIFFTQSMSFRRNDLRNCSRGGLGWSECNLISLSITSSEIQTSLWGISLPCLQGLVQEWSHNPVKANKNEGKFTKGFWSFLALQEGAIRTSLPGPEYYIVRTRGLTLVLSSTTKDETSDYKGAQLEPIWHQHTYPQLQLDSFSYITQETFLLYSRLRWNFCFWRPKIWYLIYTKGSFGILKSQMRVKY